ncbi:MAG: hypothetical protein NC432_10700 [Roseburia sp.]|nr:hypothetical protein [Roseburia sp.]MCM1099248.1 hypothetical protein [Ruminococcus flavefaciens]
MPWCPKCKTEYREGFTVCADCGSELVAEQPPEEKAKGSLPEYAEPEFPEEETIEEPEEERWEAGKKRKKNTGSRGGIYQDSSERASENRSSAWILLALGALGLAAVVLCVAGVIPMRMGNPYLFYGVMGAVFILFIVAGIVSLKNAKFFEKKAESENSLRNTLQDWCRENLDADEIDGRVGAQGLSEEVLYFRRFVYIKERLNHQFVNLDQSFLDSFIDEYVYEQIFESRE